MIEDRPIRGDLQIVEVPVNDLVRTLGNDKAGNMVMLGAFIKRSGLVSLETMNRVVKDTFSSRNQTMIKLNNQALQLGFDYLG
jgi:2-oxoglutarate ferredoxin oxidoreductase subunit gamma